MRKSRRANYYEWTDTEYKAFRNNPLWSAETVGKKRHRGTVSAFSFSSCSEKANKAKTKE